MACNCSQSNSEVEVNHCYPNSDYDFMGVCMYVCIYIYIYIHTYIYINNFVKLYNVNVSIFIFIIPTYYLRARSTQM